VVVDVVVVLPVVRFDGAPELHGLLVIGIIVALLVGDSVHGFLQRCSFFSSGAAVKLGAGERESRSVGVPGVAGGGRSRRCSRAPQRLSFPAQQLQFLHLPLLPLLLFPFLLLL
jgi:hypothetical protein